jgi:DNA-binding transcriptional MerR regulator
MATGPSLLNTRAATAKLGVTSRTIRFYCEAGIVTPIGREGPSGGNTRLFRPADMARLRMTIELRKMNMPMADILSLFGIIDGTDSKPVKVGKAAAVISEFAAGAIDEALRIRNEAGLWAGAAEGLCRHARQVPA